MTDQNNRREFTRAPACIAGEIIAQGERRPIQGRTKNISIGGMYFSCDEPFPVGTACQLVLFLDGAGGVIRIEATGTVRRVEAASPQPGLAIQFTAIELESFEHLRKLVLYNTDDTQQVEEECKIHIGLKRRSRPDADQDAA